MVKIIMEVNKHNVIKLKIMNSITGPNAIANAVRVNTALFNVADDGYCHGTDCCTDCCIDGYLTQRVNTIACKEGDM